jgi:hypothetical protein
LNTRKYSTNHFANAVLAPMPLRCFAPCNTLRATTWPRGNVLVSEDGGVFSDDALHVGGGGGEAFLETVVLWDGV